MTQRNRDEWLQAAAYLQALADKLSFSLSSGPGAHVLSGHYRQAADVLLEKAHDLANPLPDELGLHVEVEPPRKICPRCHGEGLCGLCDEPQSDSAPHVEKGPSPEARRCDDCGHWRGSHDLGRCSAGQDCRCTEFRSDKGTRGTP